MADAGLFIGWGGAVHGRERKGLQVFNEAVEYFQGLQKAGEIEGFEAVLLEPHGGDLNGFFLLRGQRDRISRVRGSDELQRLNTRANQIVEGYGVVGASLGEGIPSQIALYEAQLDELA
jgi:hypothetical protein